MANIKSAIKRAGTNRKENLRNREDRSVVKTALRRYDAVSYTHLTLPTIYSV